MREKEQGAVRWVLLSLLGIPIRDFSVIVLYSATRYARDGLHQPSLIAFKSASCASVFAELCSAGNRPHFSAFELLSAMSRDMLP